MDDTLFILKEVQKPFYLSFVCMVIRLSSQLRIVFCPTCDMTQPGSSHPEYFINNF